MKIKYKIRGVICQILCPYENNGVNVNSWLCTKCKYYGRHVRNQWAIICNYPKTKRGEIKHDL